MGEVQGQAGGERVGANWLARYGYTDLADLEPFCVIDSLTYGVGEVTWTTPGGGKRQVGLRPLWPDAEREQVYADFYSQLQADIERWGLKVPVLLWKINGKLYVRYGASRLWVFKKKGIPSIRSIICDFDCEGGYSLANWVPISTPMEVVTALGDPKYIGTFEVSHERIDIHNVVPW